jgi:hypothetical protein
LLTLDEIEEVVKLLKLDLMELHLEHRLLLVVDRSRVDRLTLQVPTDFLERLRMIVLFLHTNILQNQCVFKQVLVPLIMFSLVILLQRIHR